MVGLIDYLPICIFITCTPQDRIDDCSITFAPWALEEPLSFVGFSLLPLTDETLWVLGWDAYGPPTTNVAYEYTTPGWVVNPLRSSQHKMTAPMAFQRMAYRRHNIILETSNSQAGYILLGIILANESQVYPRGPSTHFLTGHNHLSRVRNHVAKGDRVKYRLY